MLTRVVRIMGIVLGHFDKVIPKNSRKTVTPQAELWA
jgi:hypothetical protein